MKSRTGLIYRLALVCLIVILSMIFLFASPVQAAPNIIPSTLPDGQVGVPYAATLIAVPLSCPCTWAVTSGALPGGLTLDASTGTISGEPTETGTFAFFIEVSDTTSPPPSPQQGFVISVTALPLTFLTSILPDATEDDSYYEEIEISGGTSPYTFSIVSGELPDDLTLSTTSGIITGTPDDDTTGTYTFTVRVTDSSVPQLSSERSYIIDVTRDYFKSLISIATSLEAGSTKIYVNGGQVDTLEGGESTELNFDSWTSQTITVDTTVEHPDENNVRFTTDTDRIVVSEYSRDATFQYNTEYFINFKSSPSAVGQITGSGWYKDGYLLSTSVESEIDGDTGTQYRFEYWTLPTGETVRDDYLNLTVTMPGDYVANYGTYHKLTLVSPYGTTGSGTWHKAGGEAQWTIDPAEVSMTGVLGMFGGKFKAITSGGTVTMDEPKTVNITWDSDYSRPILFISLIAVAIGLAIFALLRRREPQPAPAPQAAPPQTTFVMIGDGSRQQSLTTREQLMERFSELLEKYEDEIKGSVGTTAEPMLLESGAAMAAEGVLEDEPRCKYKARKLLRVVTGNWRQVETRTTPQPTSGKKKGASNITIVWARDIYNEWEILTCLLPSEHAGNHQGNFRIVYTLLNTITEEKTYQSGEETIPPAPHFTDGMPELEVTDKQTIALNQLPTEELP
ncbi:Ig domain-containing protein [Chloroflexota bacterium]